MYEYEKGRESVSREQHSLQIRKTEHTHFKWLQPKMCVKFTFIASTFYERNYSFLWILKRS